jgi:hypothetical protein
MRAAFGVLGPVAVAAVAAITALAAIAALAVLAGCAERRDPTDVSIEAHPATWIDPASPDFHGERVAQSGFRFCRHCHGEDLQGTASLVGCYGECHDGPGGHPAGWVDEDSPDFHWEYIRRVGNNDECRRCHGSALGGGWSGIDCESCHV